MARKQESRRKPKWQWLVRAPNGDLYVISKNKKPKKLVGRQADAVQDILKKAEGDIRNALAPGVAGVGSCVKVGITEAFGHD
jgi:hypothetical protein